MKQVYVEGQVNDKGERSWPSLSEVAELFDIYVVRVKERSSRDGWVEQRAAFQAHIERVRQQRRSTELAKEAVELDGRALTVAKMGMQLCSMRAGEIAKRAQEMARMRADAGPEGDPDDYGLPLADSKELETLARAAQAWHQLGSKALGEVETTRTEITGAAGRPLEVAQSIRAELVKDDPMRLHGFIVALQRSNLLQLEAGPQEAGSVE